MPVHQIPTHLQAPLATRRARGWRTVAMVLLGLQALLWGGGSIAEAKAAAESLSRVTHVEEQGSRACPPLHSHLDCLICRTWHGGASSGQASAVVAAFSVEDDQPSAELVAIAKRVFSGTPGSRAPPGA